MTWRLRGCPRCGGDIRLYEDENRDWVKNCLQCGYDAVLKMIVDWQMPVAIPVEKPDVRQPSRS